MYARILVPLDGSELAEQVLPYAEALAEKFGSTLVLVRAILTEPLVGAPAMMPIAGVLPPQGQFTDPTPVLEAERHAGNEYLNSVAALLGQKGLAVESRLQEGDPAGAILEEAQKANAELIAMTTHGRTGLRRLVLGSVADEVVRSATCPVLLVRVQEHHLKEE